MPEHLLDHNCEKTNDFVEFPNLALVKAELRRKIAECLNQDERVQRSVFERILARLELITYQEILAPNYKLIINSVLKVIVGVQSVDLILSVAPYDKMLSIYYAVVLSISYGLMFHSNRAKEMSEILDGRALLFSKRIDKRVDHLSKNQQK